MATINVPADQATLTAAAAAAGSGDLILVAAGVYDELVTLNGNCINTTWRTTAGAECRGFITEAAATGVTIDGFTITHNRTSYWDGGVLIKSNGVTVQNCFIHNAYHFGVHSQNSPQDITIRNNHILRCEKGIIIDGTNWLVEDNEIERPLYHFDDADYMRFWGSNHVIRGNYLHGARRSEVTAVSHTDGFQSFFGPVLNVLIERNIIQGFDEGVMIEAVDGDTTSNVGLTVRNNLFIGTMCDESGDLVRDGSGVPVPQGAWGISARGGNATGTGGIINLNCYNNTFALIELFGYGNRDDGTGEIYNNIFYRVGRPYNGTNNSPTGLDFDYNLIFDYDVFQGPFGPNDIMDVDPLLLNPLNIAGVSGNPFAPDNGFGITENSPARNAGNVIGSVIVDILGRTRPEGAAYDMGAFEFTPQTPSWPDKWKQDTFACGCDGTVSCRVSASRVVWFFADTVYDVTKARVFPPATLPRSSVATQDNDGDLVFYFGAGGTAFWPVPTTVVGTEWYWPTHAEIGADSNLYVYGWCMKLTSGLPDVIGTCRFRVTNPTAMPTSWAITEQAWTNFHDAGAPGERAFTTEMVSASGTAENPATRPTGGAGVGNVTPSGTQQTLPGGAPVVTPAGGVGSLTQYRYIYGYYADFGAVPVNKPLVARVLQSEFDANDQSSWQFWDGSGWTSNIQLAASLWTGDTGAAMSGTEYAVMYHDASGFWYAFYVSDIFGDGTVLCRRSSSPQGPWSAPVEVYTPVILASDPGYIAYGPKLHPEVSGQSVQGLLLTVNTNAGDLAKLATDLDIYYPEFVDLPADLSTLFA